MEWLASLCLTPIAPERSKMLDLSPDESGGTEFSLILFSFSKECLTGNHHRSKHTGVHCTMWIQYSGVLGLWGEQRGARHCASIAREQWAEAPNLGATRGPKHAPCPEGTGYTDGSTSLLHQNLGTLKSCSNSHVPYLLNQVNSGKAANHKSSLEIQLDDINTEPKLWGHFLFVTPMTHAGKGRRPCEDSTEDMPPLQWDPCKTGWMMGLHCTMGLSDLRGTLNTPALAKFLTQPFQISLAFTLRPWL